MNTVTNEVYYEWLIKGVERLGAMFILIAVVGGLFWYFTKHYPELMKQVDAEKMKRAEIYAGALTKLGEQIGNQSKQIEHFGNQVEKFGEQVMNQTQITKMMLDGNEKIYSAIKDMGARCIEHGSVLAILKDRTGKKVKE